MKKANFIGFEPNAQIKAVTQTALVNIQSFAPKDSRIDLSILFENQVYSGIIRIKFGTGDFQQDVENKDVLEVVHMLEKLAKDRIGRWQKSGH